MEGLAADIRTFFPDFRITVTDLKSPTASFVRDFYCRVLLELGVDVDNVRRTQMNQLDTEEMDIIPELNLVTALRTAFPFLGFRLYDLILPEIKRNAALMSHVMHFMQFCDARCAANNERVEEIQTARNNEVELEKIKERESNMLNSLACEVDKNMQAKERLEKDIIELETEIGKFRIERNEICLPMQEAEEMVSAKESKINSLQREINLIVAECEELKKLMVYNPDEVQRDLEAKTRDRERVLEKQKEYQDKLKSLNENKDKLLRIGEMLTKKVKPLLQELPVLLNYNDLKSTNEEALETVKDLQNKKDELIKSLEDIEKKLEFSENNILEKKSDIDKEELSVKEIWDSLKSDYKSKSKDVKQAESMLNLELEKVMNRISSIENDWTNMLDKYNKVKKLLMI